jgi:hypothetical protein
VPNRLHTFVLGYCRLHSLPSPPYGSSEFLCLLHKLLHCLIARVGPTTPGRGTLRWLITFAS